MRQAAPTPQPFSGSRLAPAGMELFSDHGERAEGPHFPYLADRWYFRSHTFSDDRIGTHHPRSLFWTTKMYPQSHFVERERRVLQAPKPEQICSIPVAFHFVKVGYPKV